jgi:hypothetical protein
MDSPNPDPYVSQLEAQLRKWKEALQRQREAEAQRNRLKPAPSAADAPRAPRTSKPGERK